MNSYSTTGNTTGNGGVIVTGPHTTTGNGSVVTLQCWLTGTSGSTVTAYSDTTAAFGAVVVNSIHWLASCCSGSIANGAAACCSYTSDAVQMVLLVLWQHIIVTICTSGTVVAVITWFAGNSGTAELLH